MGDTAPSRYQPSEDAQRLLRRIGWDLTRQGLVPHPCSERDTYLLDLLLCGRSVEELSARYSLSPRVIGALALKHIGLNARTLVGLHRGLVLSQQRRYKELSLVEALESVPVDQRRTRRELASLSGMSVSDVAVWLNAHPEYEGVVAGRGRPWVRVNTWTKPRASDEDILDEIRRVHSQVDSQGREFTGPVYDSLRSKGSVSQVRIIQRFGTWGKACDLAGVSWRPPVRSDYSKEWTRDEVLDFVVWYLEEHGPEAGYAGYDGWARGMREELEENVPSGTSLRNYLGSWSEIKSAALERMVAE